MPDETEPLRDPPREPLTALPWKRKEDHPALFYDGDQYLVALQTRYKDGPYYWEYAVVRVRCDEDYFAVELDGESWGWEWDDVEFYIRLSEFRVAGAEARSTSDSELAKYSGQPAITTTHSDQQCR